MGTVHDATSSGGFFNVIGHPVRWQLLAALAAGDLRVQELARRVSEPMNLVSYHLAKLRGLGLVKDRRSDADSRDVYYNLELDRLHRLYSAAGEALHPSLALEGAPSSAVAQPNGKPLRCLFLCTENSARSQMAEGILRYLSHGTAEAFSAGTAPTSVHPLAVQVMAEMQIDISQQQAKAADQFLGQAFDYIVTVCDRAKEVCPSFPGDPERIHWSIDDPAAAVGDEDTRHRAFKDAAVFLTVRIRYLLAAWERKQSRLTRPQIQRGEEL